MFATFDAKRLTPYAGLAPVGFGLPARPGKAEVVEPAGANGLGAVYPKADVAP